MQRHVSDCGVAALAMFLGATYEDVLIALGPSALRKGVWFSQLIRAASDFGVTLKRKPSWDAEADEGIAQVCLARRRLNHVMVLRAGLLFDTDLTVWEPEDWLQANRGRIGAILIRA